MKMTFRWYGKTDPVSLEYISQIPGMTGVVTAIYDIPVGEVWPLDKIMELKEEVNEKNLEMKVIESVPVHEDIKMGLPSRDKYIENYKENIRNLAKAGVEVICYNFMPVFDWTRSNLDYKLSDGSTALVYYRDEIEKMDPRKGELSLPGWDASYKKEELNEILDKYKEISEEDLWKNLRQKITQNNLSEIKEHPITDKEFDSIKMELLTHTKTPFHAAKWLKGENGIARITIEREDASLGAMSLILYSNQDIGGGISTYEVVNQIAKKKILYSIKFTPIILYYTFGFATQGIELINLLF